MGRDGIRTQIRQPLFQIVRDSFRQPPRIDEDERRAMLPNEFSHTIIHIGPDGIRRDRA